MFPANPSDRQIHEIEGVQYRYHAADNAWIKIDSYQEKLVVHTPVDEDREIAWDYFSDKPMHDDTTPLSTDTWTSIDPNTPVSGDGEYSLKDNNDGTWTFRITRYSENLQSEEWYGFLGLLSPGDVIRISSIPDHLDLKVETVGVTALENGIQIKTYNVSVLAGSLDPDVLLRSSNFAVTRNPVSALHKLTPGVLYIVKERHHLPTDVPSIGDRIVYEEDIIRTLDTDSDGIVDDLELIESKELRTFLLVHDVDDPSHEISWSYVTTEPVFEGNLSGDQWEVITGAYSPGTVKLLAGDPTVQVTGQNDTIGLGFTTASAGTEMLPSMAQGNAIRIADANGYYDCVVEAEIFAGQKDGQDVKEYELKITYRNGNPPNLNNAGVTIRVGVSHNNEEGYQRIPLNSLLIVKDPYFPHHGIPQMPHRLLVPGDMIKPLDMDGNNVIDMFEYIDVHSGGGVPTGTILMWPTTNPPAGYQLADGSRAQSDLLSVLLGGGAGSTRANVPDLRGQFIRGLSPGNNTILSNHQDTTRRPRTNFTGSTNSAGAHGHRIATYRMSYDWTGRPGNSPAGTNDSVAGSQWGWNNNNIDSNGAHTHSITINGGGDSETAPVHTILAYIIKY